MTKALFDKLVRLDNQAAKWEAVYLLSLRQAGLAHELRRGLEQRLFTLLNLSAWVKGQW